MVDAFVDAFNARDLDRLTALLLDSTSIEVVGTHTEYGPEAARTGVFYGMLFGAERLAAADTQGGIEARHMQGVLPSPPRCELRVHRGEALVLLWYAHADGEAVRAVNRIEAVGDRIQRLQNYFFTPDFIAEVCTELGVPFRLNGYRFWLEGFYDQYVHEPMQKIVVDRLRPSGKSDSHGVEQARATLATAYSMIDPDMANEKWAMGDTFTMADCAAAPALYYANLQQPLGAAHPNAQGYLARLLARDSVVRVLREAEPYMHMVPK